ncbi:hypothetical protein [Veillonella sp.]|uniref:hypothetical protein n=1 Tax=Veillonella sp. TaxID=1926307 RepID=UPI00290847D2|nr:hypothetical protein [Veillonella sp.]MDU4008757.1 hypothetical protein [Veillonella sp.]
MITDKQGMEWLFKKLYDNGWRYYVKNIGGDVFLTKKEPVMIDNILDIRSGGLTKLVNAMAEIMPNIDEGRVLDIAEELGVVDWSKVAVDTPILVSIDDETWLCRYFAAFKNGIVYTWSGGATSWSVRKREYQDAWSLAKLAEV